MIPFIWGTYRSQNHPDSRLVVARGSRGAGMRNYCLNSIEFRLCKMERATKMDGGDGCTICCCCLVAKLCPTLVTPGTVARHDPLSTGFPRQDNWTGLPFPSPGDLPDPGIEPISPAQQILYRWAAECIQNHWMVHLKMVRMVNFMLGVFYHD